jgi:serine/threonine protein kinase
VNVSLKITREFSACRTLLPLRAMGLVVGSTMAVGEEIGGGAFGTVYSCVQIAGSKVAGLVVKRHHENSGVTPEQCAGVLGALHAAVDARWGTTAAAVREHLAGMPFWVGWARWGGDEVMVSVSVNLIDLGYEPFDPILESPSRLSGWLALSILDRLQIARTFAASHALCEEMDFLHADVNVENMFVDPSGRRSTLIDFDSGCLPGSPNPRPLTWGKPDDFVAPEAKVGGRLDPDAIDRFSERWAVGWMLHYLLFGVGPLFFLTQLSSPVIGQYLAAFTWPDIDHNSPLFNRPNRSFYSRYLQELAELPVGAIEMFRQFVTVGALDPHRRPSSSEWCDALDSVTSPPVFERVTLSTETILYLQAVQVSWTASGADTVTIDGAGTFANHGRAQVIPSRSGPIRLVARNAFGAVEHLTAHISVLRGPRLVVLLSPKAIMSGTRPAPIVGNGNDGFRVLQASGTIAMRNRHRISAASVSGSLTKSIGPSIGFRRLQPRPIRPARRGWPAAPRPDGP